MSLTLKQARFVNEYLIDLNALQAAIRAKYSQKTAASQGARLLINANVQAAIAKELKARSVRTDIKNDRVLLEIARLAFNDPRRAFDDKGVLLPINQWPDDVAASISSIKTEEIRSGDGIIGHTREIKFWDKNSALNKAMKHLGMYERDNRREITVKAAHDLTDDELAIIAETGRT